MRNRCSLTSSDAPSHSADRADAWCAAPSNPRPQFGDVEGFGDVIDRPRSPARAAVGGGRWAAVRKITEISRVAGSALSFLQTSKSIFTRIPTSNRIKIGQQIFRRPNPPRGILCKVQRQRLFGQTRAQHIMKRRRVVDHQNSAVGWHRISADPRPILETANVRITAGPSVWIGIGVIETCFCCP